MISFPEHCLEGKLKAISVPTYMPGMPVPIYHRIDANDRFPQRQKSNHGHTVRFAEIQQCHKPLHHHHLPAFLEKIGRKIWEDRRIRNQCKIINSSFFPDIWINQSVSFFTHLHPVMQMKTWSHFLNQILWSSITAVKRFRALFATPLNPSADWV